MDALAELTAEQGYEATKISDIVKRAGVARKTLYDNFEGKEEVFLAAFDAAHEEVLERIEAGCAEVDGGWQERIEAGLAAFLGYVAENPSLARMCMIEALSATPAATKRYEDALQEFVEMTQAQHARRQEAAGDDRRDAGRRRRLDRLPADSPRPDRHRQGPPAGADRVHGRSVFAGWLGRRREGSGQVSPSAGRLQHR